MLLPLIALPGRPAPELVDRLYAQSRPPMSTRFFAPPALRTALYRPVISVFHCAVEMSCGSLKSSNITRPSPAYFWATDVQKAGELLSELLVWPMVSQCRSKITSIPNDSVHFTARSTYAW